MWKSGLGWQPQHREEAEERGKGQDRDGSGAASHTRSRLIECSSPSRLTSYTTRRVFAMALGALVCLYISLCLCLCICIVRSSVRAPPVHLSEPESEWDCACSCVCARFCRASYVRMSGPRQRVVCGLATGEWRLATVTDTDTDRINGVRAPTGRRALYA